MRSFLLLVMLLAAEASAQPQDVPPTELVPDEVPIEPASPEVPPPVESRPPPPPAPFQAPPAPFVVTAAAPPVEKGPSALCFDGKRSECKSIGLIEAGYRGGVSQVSTFDVGVIFNYRNHAFGATVGWVAYEHRLAPGKTIEASFVPKARYRRWLSNEIGVDVGVGGGSFGVNGEVAIEWRDIIAISAGSNTFPVEMGRGLSGTVGVRVGAKGLLALLYVAASLAGGR